MAHAAFSPADTAETLAPVFGVTPEALAAAEEARVNVIANRAGADVSALTDGTEAAKAKIAAKSNDWRAALLLTLTTWGTDAEGRVKHAIARNAPISWKKEIAAFRRRVKHGLMGSHLRSLTAYETERGGEKYEVPQGFLQAVRIARLLDVMGTETKETDRETKAREAEEKREADRYKAAKRFTKRPEFTAEGYEPVRLMDNDLDARHRGKIATKRTAANVGKKPRHMSRLLTDPQRRVFDRKTRTNGGVVLVDMSGSMHLEERDIDAILEAAGGATVIGYSSIGGDRANVWVIADNGHRTTQYPQYGSENAVDGSALNYAASMRRNKREPFIWVSDGRAYGKNGGFGTTCANTIHHLCTKYGVHTADNVADAVAELNRTKRGNISRPRLSPWAEDYYQHYKREGQA
jgi:hypothetical protein